MRLCKQIGVYWPSTRNMLKKIRMVTAHRDSIYRLESLIEIDDTHVGGKRSEKRGRGAEGKKPILVAVESRDKTAGVAVIKTVDALT